MNTENPIKRWREAKDKLDAYKHEEALLRRELAASALENIAMENGVARVKQTRGGWLYKATQELSYTLSIPVLREIWKDLSEEERDCIKTKPSLHVPSYKKLPQTSLLHSAVESKESMPKFEATKV